MSQNRAPEVKIAAPFKPSSAGIVLKELSSNPMYSARIKKLGSKQREGEAKEKNDIARSKLIEAFSKELKDFGNNHEVAMLAWSAKLKNIMQEASEIDKVFCNQKVGNIDIMSFFKYIDITVQLALEIEKMEAHIDKWGYFYEKFQEYRSDKTRMISVHMVSIQESFIPLMVEMEEIKQKIVDRMNYFAKQHAALGRIDFDSAFENHDDLAAWLFVWADKAVAKEPFTVHTVGEANQALRGFQEEESVSDENVAPTAMSPRG